MVNYDFSTKVALRKTLSVMSPAPGMGDVTCRCARRNTCCSPYCSAGRRDLPLAQSAELLRTYQKYEAAKSGGEIDQALKQGAIAAQLTEQAGQQQDLEIVPRSWRFCGGPRRKAAALGSYQHALALKQKRLGSTHPDLVPLIGDIAQLKCADRRFKEAAALYERVVAIDRAAYGADHERW